MRKICASFEPHVWVNVHSGMEASILLLECLAAVCILNFSAYIMYTSFSHDPFYNLGHRGDLVGLSQTFCNVQLLLIDYSLCLISSCLGKIINLNYNRMIKFNHPSI